MESNKSNKILFYIIIIVVVADDTYYLYWAYLSSDHPFQAYYKVRQVVLQSAMVCYYKVRQNSVAICSCYGVCKSFIVNSFLSK